MVKLKCIEWFIGFIFNEVRRNVNETNQTDGNEENLNKLMSPSNLFKDNGKMIILSLLQT